MVSGTQHESLVRLPWASLAGPSLGSPLLLHTLFPDDHSLMPQVLAPPCSQLPVWLLRAVQATDFACLCPLPPDVDSGYYTVKFESLLLKEAVLEGDSVLPPLRAEPAGSSDSDSGDEADEGDASYAKGVAKPWGPRS